MNINAITAAFMTSLGSGKQTWLQPCVTSGLEESVRNIHHTQTHIQVLWLPGEALHFNGKIDWMLDEDTLGFFFFFCSRSDSDGVSLLPSSSSCHPQGSLQRLQEVTWQNTTHIIYLDVWLQYVCVCVCEGCRFVGQNRKSHRVGVFLCSEPQQEEIWSQVCLCCKWSNDCKRCYSRF